MSKNDDRAKLIAGLNKSLEWEYAAMIQYVQHAAVITGPEFDSIQKELIIHSQEELAHANVLAEQIGFFDGTPSVDVEEREVAADPKKMLEQDLAGEEGAILRYKALIAQAEGLGEYGLRRHLEDLLIQEEEHKRDLLSALKR